MERKRTTDPERRSCLHKTHRCYLPLHENYNYCYRHILEDRTAPFKQCSFAYANTKRCALPSPKPDDHADQPTYCKKHGDIIHLAKVKLQLPICPEETPEKVFLSLSHFADSAQSVASDGHDDTKKFETILAKAKSFAADVNIFDYEYESDDEFENPKLVETWPNAEDDTSETDNDDSEPEDYLKNAGVYTAEEILKLTRAKLMRLEKLYVEQFKYFQYFLREKRRTYLHNLKKEKEFYSSIHKNRNSYPKAYNELKMLNQYQKNNGTDANLAKKVREQRVKITAGLSTKSGGSAFQKCVFAEDGVKCVEKQLPASKYCRKHILKDPLQVLYRACGAQPLDTPCPVPIPDIFPEATCVFHMNMPEIRTYKKIKKDEDSDMDDQPSLVSNYSTITEQLSRSSAMDDTLASGTAPADQQNSSGHGETTAQAPPAVYCPTAQEKQHALELITLKHLLGV